MFVSNRAKLVRNGDIERLLVDRRPVAAFDASSKCAFKLGPCDDINNVDVYLRLFLAKYVRHGQCEALVNNWNNVVIGNPIPKI